MRLTYHLCSRYNRQARTLAICKNRNRGVNIMGREGKQWLQAMPFFRFIKTYPRISAIAGLAIIVVFIALPGYGQDKLAIIFRALAMGFLIALCFYCFRAVWKSR